MREFDYESFDGKKICAYEYMPDIEPVGMVQIVHGMKEHFLRYDGFGRYLSEKGFIVFGEDHRAHGKTDSDRLGKPREEDVFEDTLKDVAMLSMRYKESYPDLKTVLFGHSYGSFLSQAYISCSYKRFISGVILSGSGYMRGLESYMGQLLSTLQCDFKKDEREAKLIEKLSFERYEKKLGGNFITGIEEEYKKYEEDEFCGFPCSAGFYRSMFSAFNDLYSKRRSEELSGDLPVLIISGAEDPVGKMGKGVRKLAEYYQKNGVKEVKTVIIPDSRHEVLNDVGREEALKHITSFCFACTVR